VAICKRMMAKSLDERFQTADDVEQALGRWLSDRGGGRQSAFQSGGMRTAGGPQSGGTPPGGPRPGGVQTAQRVLQKAKPADDSGNRLPGVGDTLTGSGQPTTKGPAGSKSSDSSSKLGGKGGAAAKAGDSGSAPVIGPPPAAANKKPGDSSGNFNFNIKTDDSNVLSNKSGKKSAAKSPGDSSGGSDPKNPTTAKATVPAKGTNPPKAAVPATKKPAAPAAKQKAPGDSGKQAADEAPAKPKPLRKKTSARKVIIWGVLLVALCIGLVVGLIFAIKHTEAVRQERIRQAEQEAVDRDKAKKEREQKEAEAAKAALDAVVPAVAAPQTKPDATTPAPAAAPAGS